MDECDEKIKTDKRRKGMESDIEEFLNVMISIFRTGSLYAGSALILISIGVIFYISMTHKQVENKVITKIRATAVSGIMIAVSGEILSLMTSLDLDGGSTSSKRGSHIYVCIGMILLFQITKNVTQKEEKK